MKHRFNALWLLVLLYGSSYGFMIKADYKESSETQKIDNHITLQLFDCTFLKDSFDYQILLWYAAYVSGMRVLHIDTCLKLPEWKCCVYMNDSSVTIHAWPNLGYVWLDICTSNESMDANKTLACLLNLFQPKSINRVNLERGYELGK